MQNIELFTALVQDTVRETAEEKLQVDKLIETDCSTTSTQDVNLKLAQNRGKVLQWHSSSPVASSGARPTPSYHPLARPMLIHKSVPCQLLQQITQLTNCYDEVMSYTDLLPGKNKTKHYFLFIPCNSLNEKKKNLL